MSLIVQPDYDYLIKAIVVGNSGVGKSSLIHRFAHRSFNPYFVSTIGVDYEVKTIDVDGKRVKMQLWDCAGNERFRTITTSYYRGAHAVMLVFDVNDESSLDSIPSWIREVQDHTNPNQPGKILLIGNKSDLHLQGNTNPASKLIGDQKQVEFQLPDRIVELLERVNGRFILTSAKNNLQVDAAFKQMALDFIQERLLHPLETTKGAKPLVLQPVPVTAKTPLFSNCCHSS